MLRWNLSPDVFTDALVFFEPQCHACLSASGGDIPKDHKTISDCLTCGCLCGNVCLLRSPGRQEFPLRTIGTCDPVSMLLLACPIKNARRIPSVRNGYRFAKYEGESIVTSVEKCPKTAGFYDLRRGARSPRSRSIHRDA
jgi:hypothetical protein